MWTLEKWEKRWIRFRTRMDQQVLPFLFTDKDLGPRHQACSGHTVRSFSFLRLVLERGRKGGSRFFQALLFSSARMGCGEAHRPRSPNTLEKWADSFPALWGGRSETMSPRAVWPHRLALSGCPGRMDFNATSAFHALVSWGPNIHTAFLQAAGYCSPRRRNSPQPWGL